MNINHLRIPEALNHYLNVEIKTLPVRPPDFMLQLLLWQKISNDFLINDQQVNQLFVDDQEHILAIEVNDFDIKSVIGYLHVSESSTLNADHSQLQIVNRVMDFIKKLEKVTIDNNWKRNQIFLITTYQLSGLPHVKYDSFPNYIKYMYLTEVVDPKDLTYEVAMDTEINEFMEGDKLLKELLDFGSSH